MTPIEQVLVKKRSRLPAGVVFLDDINLLVWKPVGIITEQIVKPIVSFLDHHEAAHPVPFDRFTDTSFQNAIDLNYEYVVQVALYRRMVFADRAPAKSAFHVVDPDIAKLIRIHAMVTSNSPLQVALFEHYQAAAEWLGVPVRRLN
jgi:hypothetical protein